MIADPSGLSVNKNAVSVIKEIPPDKLIISILKDTYQLIFYDKSGINQSFPNS